MPRGIPGSGPFANKAKKAQSNPTAPAATEPSTIAPVDTTTTNAPNRLGWLMWWTIHQSTTFNLEELRRTATQRGLPQWVIEKISGRQPESAWTVATQLGARGVASATNDMDPAGSRSRYLTRDIEEDVRAIVRETVDSQNVKVGAQQVAVLTRGASGSVVTDFVNFPTTLVKGEVNQLIRDMEDKASQLIGNMDDARVRQIVLEWLSRNYRVCLRGTGGVYFIPRPKDAADADKLESEIAGMRGWITDTPICGTFSYAAITDAAGTTVEDFVSAAVDDIKAAVEDVNGKLDEYAGNPNMNAGSQMFSANEMHKRLDGIRKKMTVLQDALGEKVGVLDEMLRLVEKRAATMVRESTAVVEQQRLQRVAAKQPAGKPMVDGKEQQPAGKAGTAKQRAAAKKIE